MQELDTTLNRRILIIDDNLAIHEDFRKLLVPEEASKSLLDAEAAFFGEPVEPSQTLHIELDSANQGKSGLKKVSASIASGRPYAMAFVDMRMPPGWDGLTTIEHLWKVDPDLQVVICTAYSDNSWSDICQRLGHTDQLLILKKPFDNVEVCQLALAMTEKWSLQRQARLKQCDLERLVDERTAELAVRDAALRQKQKLEAIGSLAGGVAHEFNNLLQVIQSYTRFAQEGLEETEQRFQDLTQVMKASDRAASLTSQLLCFSRADQFAPRPTETWPLLNELTHLLKPLIGENIDLRVETREDAILVMADPGGLHQVLLNLCINARDAMPGGGELTLRAETVDRTLQDCEHRGGGQPGPYVCFAVTDQGMGMSEEQIGRIFEPFFTTKEVGKGTGLGLAMVHGFVEQHRGVIDVESEPGVGTTFRILLPAAAPDQTEDVNVETNASSTSGGSETLLIAEDEPLVRSVAERILTRAGYRVLTAENGEQAVEMFNEHRDEIALTLLDVMMPRLTGREAFEQIRQVDADAQAIFCTGYDPETSHAESFEHDNLSLITKPFQQDELLRAVRQCLDASASSQTHNAHTPVSSM